MNTGAPVPIPVQHSRGGPTAKPKAPPPTPSRDSAAETPRPTRTPGPRHSAQKARPRDVGLGVRQAHLTPGRSQEAQRQGYLARSFAERAPADPLRPPHRARRTWKAGPSERREQAPLFAARREPPAPRGSPQKPHFSASLPTGSPQPTIQGSCQVSLGAQLPQVSLPLRRLHQDGALTPQVRGGPRKRKSSTRGTSPTHRNLPAGPLLVSQLTRPPSLGPSPSQRRSGFHNGERAPRGI